MPDTCSDLANFSDSSIPAVILGRSRVLGQFIHVGAEILGNGKSFCFADRTARTEKFLVKFPEFFALELTQECVGNFRGLDGTRRKNRKIAQDDAEIWVVLHETREIAQGAFAVTAIIVEKLNQSDLARWIADHCLIGRAEKRTGRIRYDFFARLCLGRFLAGFEHVDRFAQYFRFL